MVEPRQRRPAEQTTEPTMAPPAYDLSRLVAAKTRREVGSAVSESEARARQVVTSTFQSFMEIRPDIAKEMKAQDSELLRALR